MTVWMVFTTERAIREFVIGIQVSLEPDKRHDRAVVALRAAQVGDVDADMSEHLATLTADAG